MRTQYEHPPRSMTFYLKYLLILFVIILPFLLLIPLHASLTGLPIIFFLPLMIIFIIWRLHAVHKPFLENLVIIEDIHIDTETDVTAFDYAPPVQLDEILLQLELDGFERFLETETWRGFSKEPLCAWQLSQDGGRIIAQAVLSPDQKPYVAFVSQCEHGKLVTFYGTPAVRIGLENLHVTSISTNVNDALAYHRLKLQEMRPTIGQPIPISSYQQANELSERFVDLQIKQVTRSIYMAAGTHVFMNILLVSPGFLLFAPFMGGKTIAINTMIIGIPLVLIGYIGLRLLQRAFKPIDPTAYLKEQAQLSLEGDSL